MELLAAVTLLAVVTTTAATDCTVCLRGRCLANSQFYDLRRSINPRRMAIDHTSNILYHWDDGIDAIYLDNNTITAVPILGNKRHYFHLAVDQDSGDLYYHTNIKHRLFQDKPIYRYNPKTGNGEAVVIENPEASLSPLSLWVHNGTIYFNTHNTSRYDFVNGLYTLSNSKIEKVAALENITLNSIVFDKIGNMYIKSGPQIYRLKPNASEPVLFASADFLLGDDRNGEVYFFDRVKGFIYIVDSADQLVNIGAYDASSEGKKRPNVNQFMFDKNNNLILKDNWSTKYYKVKNVPAQCKFEFEENNSHTKITKL